mmetsp:Transcript_3683/g.9116  ORF Transcript_3683/g.9116 Transcript_3683/m.9116 type:complete len:308 (-) Transcript_3683:272-1195(-)
MSATMGLKAEAVPPTPAPADHTAARLSEDIPGGLGAKAQRAWTPDGGRGPAGGHRESLRESLRELQTWDQPFQSAGVVGVATLLFYLTQGPDPVCLPALGCLVLLGRVLLVAGARAGMTKIERENKDKLKSVSSLLGNLVMVVDSALPIPDKSTVSKFIREAGELVESLANRVCAAVNAASEPSDEGHAALKSVSGHLVGLVLSFYLFSVWTLLYFYVMYQMLWPVVYSRHKDRIDPIFAKINKELDPLLVKAKAAAGKAIAVAGEKAAVVAHALLDKLKPLAEKVQSAASKVASPSHAAKKESKSE